MAEDLSDKIWVYIEPILEEMFRGPLDTEDVIRLKTMIAHAIYDDTLKHAANHRDQQKLV